MRPWLGRMGSHSLYHDLKENITITTLLLLCDISRKRSVWLAPYHVALEGFLPVLTKTVEDAEYHDLIVHGLTCHPLVWRERKQTCHCLHFVFTLHLYFTYLSVEKRLGMSRTSSCLPITHEPRVQGKHASNFFSAKIQINFDYVYAVSKNLLLGWRATAGMECMLGSAIYLKSTGMSLKWQTNRWVRCSCLS